EDGIRDRNVTGVQTCALPISSQMLSTEIPDNVYQGLKASQATDIHIFGRRGPAQVKFTPLELRELKSAEDVGIVLYEDDFEFDRSEERRVGKGWRCRWQRGC